MRPLAAALRFGAVLAASGPVILTTFGIGRQSAGWFCSATDSAPFLTTGPYALQHVPGESLFWGVVLLPVAVAGLLLRGSRRATLIAVAVVGAVLVAGLVLAYALPGPDPCTGAERTAVLPWPLLVCYPLAAAALYLAARSPLPPRRPYEIALWAAAAGAAAWAAMFCRSTPIEHGVVIPFPGGDGPARQARRRFSSSRYGTSRPTSAGTATISRAPSPRR